MPRRSKHNIIAEVLDVSRSGIIKTHIMYRAKLSYVQLNEYIRLLLDNNFLEMVTLKVDNKNKRGYKTTDKGLQYLENFKKANDMIGSAGLYMTQEPPIEMPATH